MHVVDSYIILASAKVLLLHQLCHRRIFNLYSDYVLWATKIEYNKICHQSFGLNHHSANHSEREKRSNHVQMGVLQLDIFIDNN